MLNKKSPEMAKHLSERDLKQNTTVQNVTDIDDSRPKMLSKVMDSVQKDADFTGLKLQHRSFVIQYLTYKNPTKAALSAGYPQSSARSQGSRLFRKATIASLVAKYSALEAELASDEKEQLIDELHEIKREAKSFFKYSDAISAIRQISLLRGFEMPKGVHTLGKDGTPIDPVGPTIINKNYIQPNVSSHNQPTT